MTDAAPIDCVMDSSGVSLINAGSKLGTVYAAIASAGATARRCNPEVARALFLRVTRHLGQHGHSMPDWGSECFGIRAVCLK